MKTSYVVIDRGIDFRCYVRTCEPPTDGCRTPDGTNYTGMGSDNDDEDTVKQDEDPCKALIAGAEAKKAADEKNKAAEMEDTNK